MRSGVIASLAIGLWFCAATAWSQEVRLPNICIAAWDQPELWGILKDGGDILPPGTYDAATQFFVDTGSSGIVISKIIVDDFEIGPQDFIGYYIEIGIGGDEVGDVTRPFTVKLLNGSTTIVPDPLEEWHFDDYGQFNLWARRVFDIFEIWDPINIVGMPVIGQRVMVIDPTPLGELEPDRIQTFLLPAGDPGIPTAQLNAHVPITLVNFMPDQPLPGQTFPSSADNPVIPNVVLKHGLLESTGTWLLDTGAAAAFISIAQANAAGVTDKTTLEEMIPEADFTIDVIGIGGDVSLPGFLVDEVRLPTTDGFDVVFQQVELGVIDVAGLDGVFGVNFLLPSMSYFREVEGPGYFERIVIDTAGGVMGLDIFDDAFFIVTAGDLDGDGDVDLDDAALFVAAMNGPGQPPGDAAADLDEDGDCDLADLAVFTKLI